MEAQVIVSCWVVFFPVLKNELQLVSVQCLPLFLPCIASSDPQEPFLQRKSEDAL